MKLSKVFFAVLLLAGVGAADSEAAIDYSLCGGAGVYNTLIGSGTTGYNSSGSITLAISPSGFLTGKLLLANHVYSLASHLQWNMAQFHFGEKSGPLTLTLSLDTAIPAVTGSLSAATWGASFTALRTPYSRSNPAPQAGRYTLLLSPTEPGAAGQGYGYATMLIDSAGRASISGRSEFASPFSTSASIDAAGMLPLYAVSNGPAPVTLHGWIQFQSVTGVGDCAGTPGWSPSASGTSSSVALIGSRYDPDANNGMILPFGSGTGNSNLGFGQGSDSLVSVPLTLSTTRLTTTSSQVARLKLDRNTGVYSGNLNLSGSGGPFFGVAYQSQGFGAGVLIGKNSPPGWVYLGPSSNFGTNSSEDSGAAGSEAVIYTNGNGGGGGLLASTGTTYVVQQFTGSGTIVLNGTNPDLTVDSGTSGTTLDSGTNTLTLSGSIALGIVNTTGGFGLLRNSSGVVTIFPPGMGTEGITIAVLGPLNTTGPLLFDDCTIVLSSGETIISSGEIVISGGSLTVSSTTSATNIPVSNGSTEDISVVSPLTVPSPILVTSGTSALLVTGTNIVLTSGT